MIPKQGSGGRSVATSRGAAKTSKFASLLLVTSYLGATGSLGMARLICF